MNTGVSTFQPELLGSKDQTASSGASLIFFLQDSLQYSHITTDLVKSVILGNIGTNVLETKVRGSARAAIALCFLFQPNRQICDPSFLGHSVERNQVQIEGDRERMMRMLRRLAHSQITALVQDNANSDRQQCNMVSESSMFITRDGRL